MAALLLAGQQAAWRTGSDSERPGGLTDSMVVVTRTAAPWDSATVAGILRSARLRTP